MTVQELYTEIGGNYERVRRLLQMDRIIERFILKYPSDPSFDRLMEGWRAGDDAVTFEGAHAMKGLCGNLGLDRLEEAAKIVTEECRPGNAPTMTREELGRCIAQMEADHTHTLEVLRRYAENGG